MRFSDVVLSVLVLNEAHSMPQFRNEIPNGFNVKFKGEPWTRVGHNNEELADRNFNPFGKMVFDRYKITGSDIDWQDLCPEDPDGDGMSNGVELGDPNCEWDGTNDEILTEPLGHPGFNELNPTVPPAPAPAPAAVKAHAALMTLAWLVFAPIGILLPVINKVKVQSKSKRFDWFKWHKVCVGTAVYFTLLAYVIMVHLKGFLLVSVHTRLGHAVVILAIFQPINGFLRLHIRKDGTKSVPRLIWEYMHQWTGRTIAILACVTIYFGFKIAPVLDASGRKAFQVIDLLILVCVGLFCIFWVYYRTDERKQQTPLPSTKEQAKLDKEAAASKADPAVREAKPSNVKSETAGVTQTPAVNQQPEVAKAEVENPQQVQKT